MNTGWEQRKTNWSLMSAAPEAKLLNNTGEYLSLSQKLSKNQKTHLRIIHNRTKSHKEKEKKQTNKQTAAYNTHKDQLVSKFIL